MSPSHRTSLIATFAALGATLLGGSATVATRYVLPESDALTVTFLRNVGAMVLMLAVAFATTRMRVKRADLPALVVLGVLQFGVMQLLFVSAFQYVPAARGALMLSTLPVITLALAAVLRREQLTVFKTVGGLLAFAGVAVALGDRAAASGPDVWKGDLLMFGAALSGAFYNVLAGPTLLRRYPSLAVTALQLPAGVAMILVILLARGDFFSGIATISPRGWLTMFYLMSLGGVVSFFLWGWALEHTTPSSVAITLTANPIAAAILGALILGEPVTLHVLAGLVVVVAGIALANWPKAVAPVIVPGPGP